MTPAPRRYAVMTLFGRCGSVFVHSLFDGHPQLSSIPGVAAYMVTAEAAQLPMIRQASTKELAVFAAKRLGHYYNDPVVRRNAGLDKLGENGDESLDIDIQAFFVRVRHFLQERSAQPPLARLCDAMHDAFDACNAGPGENQPPKPGVFFHAHTFSHAQISALLAETPQHRVLLLMREPIDNMESIANTVLSDPDASNRIGWFHRIVRDLLSIQTGTLPHLGPDAVAIRLEDIKEGPRPMLELLCAAIDVPFDESLLRPTCAGKTFNTVPTQRNPGTRGFSQPATQQGYRLTAGDRAFFATLFRRIAMRFDYAQQETAAAEDIQQVIDGRLLDVEVELAARNNIAPADLAGHPDVVHFRQCIAAIPDILDGPACGLQCRLIRNDT